MRTLPKTKEEKSKAAAAAVNGLPNPHGNTTPKHPNIEDVYQHEAEHSGFKEGESVLLECSIISSADHVSTVAVHYLPTTPGEEIMVSNNLIYHKD